MNYSTTCFMPDLKFFLFLVMVEILRFVFVLFSGLVSLATSQNEKQYGLQNMPHTSFTCRDKILGGYYADAETNCQMFHICVKVAGVGVSTKSFMLLLCLK